MLRFDRDKKNLEKEVKKTKEYTYKYDKAVAKANRKKEILKELKQRGG